jgi:hypothetical protein
VLSRGFDHTKTLTRIIATPNLRRLVAIAHCVDAILLGFVEWLVATEETPTAATQVHMVEWKRTDESL